MKYLLRQHIPDRHYSNKHNWHFLTSVSKWDASWSPFVSKGITFNTPVEANSFLERHRAVLRSGNMFVEVTEYDDKEYFMIVLEGK